MNLIVRPISRSPSNLSHTFLAHSFLPQMPGTRPPDSLIGICNDDGDHHDDYGNHHNDGHVTVLDQMSFCDLLITWRGNSAPPRAPKPLKTSSNQEPATPRKHAQGTTGLLRANGLMGAFDVVSMFEAGTGDMHCSREEKEDVFGAKWWISQCGAGRVGWEGEISEKSQGCSKW